MPERRVFLAQNPSLQIERKWIIQSILGSNHSMPFCSGVNTANVIKWLTWWAYNLINKLVNHFPLQIFYAIDEMFLFLLLKLCLVMEVHTGSCKHMSNLETRSVTTRHHRRRSTLPQCVMTTLLQMQSDRSWVMRSWKDEAPFVLFR